MKNPHTWIELMVVAEIILVILVIFTVMCLTVKGCQAVREKGLKNVGIEFWEGPKK